MVEGLPLIQTSHGVCSGCLVGKHPEKRYEFGKAHRASSILDLIHSDVDGPIPTTSINGCRYLLTFIDDCSRYLWIYLMKHKSEVFDIFKYFKAMIENCFSKNIKPIRSNKGGEYIKRYFHHYCETEGIQMEHSVPYTPQQNLLQENNILPYLWVKL